MGSISDSLASSMAFSEVPPMPMPRMPGGHQPAPMVGTVFSTHSTMESDGFSMANFDFASEPPPLAATITSTLSPGTMRHVHHRRSVVLGVPARPGRIGQDAGAQLVVLMQVGAAHAFVHHVFDTHGRVPLDVHADLEEDGHDAGILADGPMAFGAHARVDQDLRHRVARRGRLLLLVGARHAANEIRRMVVGNVLQSVGDALDKIVLLDDGHS